MDEKAILQAVRAWPLQQREVFLSQVWDEMVEDGWQPESDEEADNELAAELDRRVAAYEADPSTGRTWDQILERLRKHH